MYYLCELVVLSMQECEQSHSLGLLMKLGREGYHLRVATLELVGLQVIVRVRAHHYHCLCLQAFH